MRKKIIKILEEIDSEIEIDSLGECLDSFDMIFLTTELEKEFGIKIDGLSIRKEKFSDINSIIKLINESRVQK